MGRKLMRVPMDFNWPLNMIWKGYLNPYCGVKCKSCDGTGYNPETKKIDEEWYAFDNNELTSVIDRYGRSSRYNRNAHCYNITQVEIDALIEKNRLMDLTKNGHIPTVEEVNDWAKKDPTGHDSINHWICVEARAKALGVWGNCPICGGHGIVYANEEIFKKHEEWEKTDPPKGEGYQLWETTTEGSPQSPVFATLDELAAWCEENATTFGSFKTSKEKWVKMLKEDNVYHSEGRFTYL
jgi:hypothetical protein